MTYPAMQIAYQNYFHKQLSGLFLQSSEKKNGFSFSMKEIAYGMQPFTFTRLMSIYGTIIMSGVHLWCPKIPPAHLVLGQSQLLYIHRAVLGYSGRSRDHKVCPW